MSKICEKCGRLILLHKHHITYPDEICYLCETCHKIITRINCKYTKVLGLQSLTKHKRDNVRRALFRIFLRYKKPIKTKKDVKELIMVTYIKNNWISKY